MSSFFKTLKWTVLASLLVGSLAVAGFVIYLETSFDWTITQEEKEQLFNFLDAQPELPESFLRTIEKHYPNYLEYGVWSALLQQILHDDGRSCPCQNISPRDHIQFTGFFHRVVVALEFNDHYSAKRCYEIRLALMDYLHGYNGVQQAAMGYYDKELTQLNEREILELDMMTQASVYFDPVHNRQNLDRAVNAILNRPRN